MKLYLASYQMGLDSQRLADLVGKRKRAALILNASDVYGDGQRHLYVKRFTEDFAELGLDAEEIDLRKYFGRADVLRRDLERFGLLWCSGGNTFTLRRAMQASGLGEMLPGLLQSTDLVYGGFSAGACVACPSLRGIHLADVPDDVPEGYAPAVIWEGLNLVNFHLVPHYRSPHPESAAMEHVVNYFKENQLDHYTLTDDQAIVVDGDRVEVIG